MLPNRTLLTLATSLTLAAAVSAQQEKHPFEAAVRAFPQGTVVQGLADITGDGELDALAWKRVPGAGGWVEEFQVFRGRGDGTFVQTPVWTTTRDTEVREIERPGDFDGDGRPDLVISRDHKVDVFLTSPAGVPVLGWIRPTGIAGVRVEDVAVGDIDGDGVDDLALVTDDELEIWLGGPGALTLAGSLPQASNKRFLRLVVADVGGGPGDELVGLIPSSGRLVSFDVGLGGIASVYAWPAVGLAYDKGTLLAGDLDGDGDDDILYSGLDADIYLQTAPGVLSHERIDAFYSAKHLADVDGDGDLDTFGTTSSIPAPRWTIRLNDGTGRFPETLDVVNEGAWPGAATDLDGDGDVDLVGGRYVYLDRGAFAAGLSPTVAKTQWTPDLLVDWEGDGDLDAVDAVLWNDTVTGTQRITVRRNDGTGAFEDGNPSVALPPPPGSILWTGPVYPGDYDGDGDTDVLVDSFLGGLRMLRNEGGALVDAGASDIVVVSPSAEHLAADLDADGDVDLAVSTTPDGGANIWLNDGTGSFQFLTKTQFGNAPVTVGDINRDGEPDLVDADTLMTFRTPDGLFGKQGDLDGRASGPVAIGDVDGNTLPDVVAIDRWAVGDKLTLYLHDTTGFFPEQRIPDTAHAVGGVGVEDVDGDGILDVVFATSNTWDDEFRVSALLGDGAGGFTRVDQLSVRQSLFRLDDLDGDGDLDAGPPLVRGGRIPTGAAGTRRQFGSATPGTGGVAPTLGATGPFRVGETMETRLVGGRGGAFAVLLVGGPPVLRPDWPAPGLEGYVGPGAVPFFTALGGSPSVPGSGSRRWPGVIPAGMRDLTITMQAFVQDTAVVPWIVQSNGIEITFR